VSVLLCRHKLPIHDTAGLFLPENDAQYTPYCRQIINRKELENFDRGRYEYSPIKKYYDERVCDPSDLPKEKIVMIDQVEHQRCELKEPYINYNCFTKEEQVTINYEAYTSRGKSVISRKVKLRTACECGSRDDRKR